jgi:hypothetical protein
MCMNCSTIANVNVVLISSANVNFVLMSSLNCSFSYSIQIYLKQYTLVQSTLFTYKTKTRSLSFRREAFHLFLVLLSRAS